MNVTFPKDGLYAISMAFETAETPGTTHIPGAWDVWMQGKLRGEAPKAGLSEWLGLGLAATMGGLFLASLLQKRRKKSTK